MLKPKRRSRESLPVASAYAAGPTTVADGILEGALRGILELPEDTMVGMRRSSALRGVWVGPLPPCFAGFSSDPLYGTERHLLDQGGLARLLFMLWIYRYGAETVDRAVEAAAQVADGGSVEVTFFKIHGNHDTARDALHASPESSARLFLPENRVEAYDLERFLNAPEGMTLVTGGDLRLFRNAPGKRAIAKIVGLKRWILEHFPPEDVERFLLIGSAVLFTYGVRPPGDLDLYVHHPEDNRLFVARFERAYYRAPPELFKDIDVILRGYRGWDVLRHEQKFLYDWPRTFGAESMSQVVVDSTFHYSFLGMKFVSFRGELERRSRRDRPASYADLFYMHSQERILQFCPFEIPALNEFVFRDNRWVSLSPEEFQRFCEGVKSYLKSRYGMRRTTEEIRAAIEGGSVIRPFDYLDNKDKEGGDLRKVAGF